jgi:hypothetical protein
MAQRLDPIIDDSALDARPDALLRVVQRRVSQDTWRSSSPAKSLQGIANSVFTLATVPMRRLATTVH